MNNYMEKISSSKLNALNFADSLKVEGGYKYTANHDFNKYPAALLYGTWSIGFLKKLILGNSWENNLDKTFIIDSLTKHRKKNGIFFPDVMENINYSKSKEYMMLHCYNYSVGAAIEIDSNFDFQSSYMDSFLDQDFLMRWLNQRSLERPWEESNNIVNVASYLALNNDYGNHKGKERLYQMLEWHNKIQNPRTGGFENFNSSYDSLLQSMAGSVHNFHIHLYLNEPMNFESLISRNLVNYLMEGPLTSCLSIDFVELACNTINYSEDKELLANALLMHLEYLLDYQNIDGGWYENENSNRPTVANGMVEEVASSNSYGTWFRLCSIGMIAITLLGSNETEWNFRKTLGMGYHNKNWSKLNFENEFEIDKMLKIKNLIRKFPTQLRKRIISAGVKVLK